MSDVVAMGELLTDFAAIAVNPAGYPIFAANPGGAPANFLATLAKLGVGTEFIGKVGRDLFGRMLAEALNKQGVGTRGLVMDERVFTTLAFVALDEAGDRGFSFARKPGADTMLRADEIDRSLIDGAKVFHFGSLSLSAELAKTATYSAVDYARAQGKLISFDPNLRLPLWPEPEEAKRQILWGLGKADIVKISDNEVEFLWELDPEAGAKKILEDFGVRLVFVTCGAEGCVFANRNGMGRAPALQGVKPVDTTGAGDIFGGSALYGLLKTGKAPEALSLGELEQISRFACTVAGLSTERLGGISSIPERAELPD